VAATPGSVTSSARRTPRRLSSQPASADAPGPNLIGVASRVKTVSRPVDMRSSCGTVSLSSMPHATLIEQLRDALGPGHVLTDDDVRAPYETDWTGRFSGTASVVARPADTAQVAAVVRACAAHGVAVVPQGGNTGLVGGGVPRGGEVLLSLARLTDLGDVDVAGAQVQAGAGVTLAALHAHAAAAGMDAGLDFGARDSATLGGIVATDAGGARALRHGTARAHVAGLEVVLSDGSVISRLSGLLKDNAGYDLPALLVGSEGTLGVVTRVRWRLVARQPARVAALIGLESAGAAAELLATLRARLPSLEAADFFLDDGLRLVLEHLDLTSPSRSRRPIYVLIECAADEDPTEALAEALGEAGVEDAIVPTTPRRASGCGGCARATPRRSTPRACRTSSTSASRSAALEEFLTPRTRVDRGRRARRAGDPVRPPGRRQRPRQRARRPARGPGGRRGGPAPGRRARRDDQRRARDRRRQDPLALARCAGRRTSPRWLRSSARWTRTVGSTRASYSSRYRARPRYSLVRHALVPRAHAEGGW